MLKNEFIKMNGSKVTGIEALNTMLTNSVEHEIGFENSSFDGINGALSRKRVNGRSGFASNHGLNDGNGWNSDLHADGFFIPESSDDHNRRATINGHNFTALEISQSPVKSINFLDLVVEQTERIKALREAAINLCHVDGGSTHCHTTLSYFNGVFEDSPYRRTELISMVDIPSAKMYREIAKFILRFMPVMKWVSMTTPIGARAARGNQYDKLDGDKLYEWWHNINSIDGVRNGIGSGDYELLRMGRSSYFRVVSEGDSSYNNILHWENRMLDCTSSPTHVSVWMMLNRAISLFAYDMVRNNIEWKITDEEVQAARRIARQHRDGWHAVDRSYIVKNYAEMKSVLVKYFKKMNSMDALDALDKLVDCPIPEFLEKNGLGHGYDTTQVEKMFAVRTREKDDTLRKAYIQSIKGLVIPIADNLNAFHDNVASALHIQTKQAISLYQMFKRENVELEFLAGRLIYMGDN